MIVPPRVSKEKQDPTTEATHCRCKEDRVRAGAQGKEEVSRSRERTWPSKAMAYSLPDTEDSIAAWSVWMDSGGATSQDAAGFIASLDCT
jgi:hypothetical protein